MEENTTIQEPEASNRQFKRVVLKISGESFSKPAYWAEFAYNRDPGNGRKGELPRWTAWNPSPGADKFAILDTPAGGGPRMSTEFVTAAQVMAELKTDPLLRNAGLRCDVLAEVEGWWLPMSDAEYEGFGCSRLPVVAAGGE